MIWLTREVITEVAVDNTTKEKPFILRALVRVPLRPMLARGTASSLSKNLNEKNTENLISGKLIMQTPNAATIAFDLSRQAFEMQLFFWIAAPK